jgi:hypothetical protein
MMKEYLKTAFTTLQEELELITDMGTLPVRRLALTLTAAGEALKKIRAYVVANPFVDAAEEMELFKNQKPLFTSEQLYAIEVFTIETNRPIGDPAALRAYFELELAVIKRFFDQYQFLYQYHIHELTELDHLLFKRGAKPTGILLPENDGADPEFCSSADKLFAKFIAYERLQVYIVAQLSGEVPASTRSDLKWTGDSINLVELIYGICLTGQVNHGNITPVQLARWFEEKLGIAIGRPHRRFKEIERRKRLPTTKFLNHMQEAVVKKVEEMVE